MTCVKVIVADWVLLWVDDVDTTTTKRKLHLDLLYKEILMLFFLDL